MYTFERIIDEIGGFGKFQIITEALLFSAYSQCSWSIMQMAIAGLVPDWYCVISESDSLENETFTEQLAKNGTWGKQNYQTCAPENGSQCSQYHFEGSTATVTEEWDLVCDRDWVRSTLISIQMAGVLVGSLIAGQLSDQYGRRRVLNAFVLFHALLNFAAALAFNWQLFATARFLIGLGIGGILTTAFPYGIEFMPLKWRALLGILPWWGIGVFMFTGFAYVLPDWRHLHVMCGLVNLPCLIAWWLAPESLRWLTAKGRIDEAEAVLQKMADTNGRTLPPWTREMLEPGKTPHGISTEKESTSYLDLFKSFYLAKCTTVSLFVWCTMSLIHYGISFAVSSLAGNLYVNMLLLVIVELPGLPFVFLLANRIGRRWTSVTLFALAFAASASSLALVLSGVAGAKSKAIRWLAHTIRLTNSCSWNVAQAWNTEIYPTVTRNIGYGAANTAARVGGILAPFIINLETGVLPTYIVLTTLTFLMVLAPFTLPETNNKILQDHLESGREDKNATQDPLMTSSDDHQTSL